MTEKGKEIRRTLPALLLTIAYAAVHLFLITKHEIWRDEAYVWGFVENAPLSALGTELSRVGHPVLWFAWLFPFVKGGLPFSLMGIASLIPMTAAVAIVLWAKDLPFLAKLAVLASPVFLYFNAVIARPYALSVLFFALLAVFWKDRLSHPFRYCLVIALLLQTHVVFAGFCGGLWLELILSGRKKEKKPFAAALLPVVSALSLLPQLVQSGDADLTVSLSGEARLAYITKEHILEGLGSVFQYNPRLLRLPLTALCFASLLLFAVLALRSKKARFRAALPACCGVVWYYLCVCLIRPVEHVHMATCLLMILSFLFVSVIAESDKKSGKEGEAPGSDKGEGIVRIAALLLLLAFGASGWIYTLRGTLRDLQGPYSGSREIARIVIDTLPQGSVLGLEEMQDSEAPRGYIAEKRSDLRFYNAWLGEDWSYYRWVKQKRPEAESIAETLRKSGGTELYYLTRKELPEDDEMELCGRNSWESVWGEEYCLYRVKAR
ncbi:MAG: hypothetical protein K6E50_07650 [Lachnospiraceae bacterium]|nr:hypothetical protein [Lachnospiraceae bacterium]